jgi:hypothetical protein
VYSHVIKMYTFKLKYFRTIPCVYEIRLNIFLVDIAAVMFGLNRLTPNDPYMGRTASLTFKRCILYIYSTNIGTDYFKHALYSPFFFSSKCSLFHNVNLFGSCIIHILYTGCVKIKKNNCGAKGLKEAHSRVVGCRFSRCYRRWDMIPVSLARVANALQ